MTVLRVHLLGGLAVAWGETQMPPIPGATARSLFAYLVSHRDRPQTRDLLAGTFWLDLPDAVARRRLSQALWQIGKALGPHPVLWTEGDTVQLNPDLPLWVDVAAFERARQATGSDLQGAADLYRGAFLAGYYDDWVLPERERLREAYLEVLDRLVAGHKQQGAYERALAFARRLVTEDPWREEAHGEVMRLCHLLGRDHEALQQFETCCRVLEEELGVVPSAETTALAAEIAARGEADAYPVLPSAARPVVTPFLERPDRLPLVGRQGELGALLQQLESAVQGTGGLTLVYGEAGVGKSRLLRELASNAQWRGVRTLWGRCYELAAPPAYQPLVEALRADITSLEESSLAPLWRVELSRLLPELELGDAEAPPLEPEEERRRLAEAIVRGFLALAASNPCLVLLEGAQWMDPASLEAIRYLVPRLAEAALLMVVTVRQEELRGQQASTLSALESTRVPRRLELGRLDLGATGELVACALHLEQPAPRFSARLHGETEGNPFFLIETLWALVEEGLLYRDEQGAWSTAWDESTDDYAELPLPAGVLQSIERRLERLPPRQRELLSLAAIIGRGVPFDLWQLASEQGSEALLDAGDELCSRGLLLAAEAEVGGADYLFAHDQIRRVAYGRLAAPRRRLYHRRVAEALERLAPDKAEALAYHWMEARVWDKAVDHHRQAGDRARAVYANAKAVDHYSKALEALDRLPGGVDPLLRYELYLAREGVHDLQGEREAQAEDLKALEGLVQARDSVAQGAGQAGEQGAVLPSWARRRVKVTLRRAQYTMAMVDYTAAIAMIQEAVSLAEAAGISELEAEGYYHWSTALWLLGQWEEARQELDKLLEMARRERLHDLEAKALGLVTHLAVEQGRYAEARLWGEQALRLFQERDDRRGESATHHSMGLAAVYEGDYAAAQSHFERSLWLAGESGYLSGEGRALTGLGIVAAEQGDPVQARSHYEQALRIFGQTGDRDREGRILNNLGFILDQLGAYAEAESHFERVLTNSYDIGSRHGQVVALVNLAHVSQRQGRHQRALQQGQEAVELAEEIGERRAQGYAWTIVGDALTSLGRLADAESAFRQALALRRALGQPNLAMESLAGLVRVALARDDLSQACAYADEILKHIQTGSLGGTKDPLLVYLSCYQALDAVHDARAARILADAYRQVQEQAARIVDDRLRRGYLENVDAHREIIAAYVAWQAPNQRTVRLPRADAPTGRPLGDDEYVAVTWTVGTPEDEALADGPARRQARLLRLLQEAADQGAAPTIGDLAGVLAVSEPTVRRDLAALRRAGHRVHTRGSRGG